MGGWTVKEICGNWGLPGTRTTVTVIIIEYPVHGKHATRRRQWSVVICPLFGGLQQYGSIEFETITH